MTITEKFGESVEREYSGFGLGQNTKINLQLKTATFQVAFISGGQIAWEWKSYASNDQWFIHHKENESITDVLERDYQSAVRNGFNYVTLPPYVFSPTSANGLGTTQLSRAK